MQKMFRVIAALFITALLPAIGYTEEAVVETFTAGEHYQQLAVPVRVDDPNKIEVAEMFWYGCAHCYSFEAALRPWAAQQQQDVNFVKVPAMWNDSMKLHAGMFYAAKQLKVLKEMHGGIFTAMHVEKKKFVREEEIQKFFADYGIAAETFNKTFNSFGVASQVKKSDARARSYQITGTPEMVVNGKYRVSSRMTGSQEKMLEVVDFLVKREREQLAAVAPQQSE